jgi:hypothetical protein
MAKTRLLSIAIGGRRSASFASKEAATAPTAAVQQYIGLTRSVGKLINN